MSEPTQNTQAREALKFQAFLSDSQQIGPYKLRQPTAYTMLALMGGGNKLVDTSPDKLAPSEVALFAAQYILLHSRTRAELKKMAEDTKASEAAVEEIADSLPLVELFSLATQIHEAYKATLSTYDWSPEGSARPNLSTPSGQPSTAPVSHA